jgi:hypothetical protein
MRVVIAAALTAVVVVCCSQDAGAAAAGGRTLGQAVESGSLLTPAFYGRSTRHGIVKCYRQLVVGPYVCRRYYRW